MKTVTCDMCDARFETESFEDWMKQMMPHYQSEHSEFMAASANKSKEDAAEWMKAARAHFDAA